MRANCGKACNHHTLHWLVKPLQGCNRQNVQIFSFHPRSAGGVASATWRLTVLSRILSPCSLIGAPLQLGTMRLTQPRGFRALRHWVWLSRFFFIAFRPFYHEICFPWIAIRRNWFFIYDYFIEYAIRWLFSCYDSCIHGNLWLLISMLRKSSLQSGKGQKLWLVTIVLFNWNGKKAKKVVLFNWNGKKKYQKIGILSWKHKFWGSILSWPILNFCDK